MRKSALFLSGLFLGNISFAQEVSSSTATFWDDPLQHPLLPYYFIIAILIVCIALTAVVAAYVIRIVKMLSTQLSKEKAAKLGIPYTPSPGWWDRFTQRMNASVPVEQEKNIEMDHSYDGIKELDNHLPPWWKWLFYGTIGWSVIYIIIYHISSSLPLSTEEYHIELARAEEQMQQLKAKQPQEAIDENNLLYTADAAIIEKGKLVFDNNPCGSCHRNDGGGNTIGPNLTDEYWIHGGTVKDVFNTIKNGAIDKGMPAWGKAMSLQDVRDVSFYIMSLQGSNPPDAKGPQGERFKQIEIVKADSTQAQAAL